jgi:hypothetical protein
VDHNKKLPVDSWSSGEIELKYPWVYGESDNLGGSFFKYRNLKEPEKNSSMTMTPSGSYETIQQDSERKEIRTNLNPGDTRAYTGGGASIQTDGHTDDNSESTRRTVTAGDVGFQGGRNLYQGFAENVIEGSKNKATFTMGASESKVYESSKGDIVSEHTGNEHKSYEGDKVTSVKGNNINMIKEGDYSLHVQSGNYDVQVETKGRIKTVSDLLIQSDTKITMKVGSSEIIIENGQITIKSGAVKFEKV